MMSSRRTSRQGPRFGLSSLGKGSCFFSVFKQRFQVLVGCLGSLPKIPGNPLWTVGQSHMTTNLVIPSEAERSEAQSRDLFCRDANGSNTDKKVPALRFAPVGMREMSRMR